MLDAMLDAGIDTAKLFPILWITYILMEWLEHSAKDKTLNLIRYSGKAGPFLGGLLGIIPQCGFSGAAASFFASHSITLGSLIAIFLATSDEMLPILISNSFKLPLGIIPKILLVKCVLGIAFGYLIDVIYHRHPKIEHGEIHEFCEQEQCDCDHGILASSFKHSISIIALIFVVSSGLNIFFELAGNEVITKWFMNNQILGGLAAGVIGLIPNCSASVLLTNLYIEGVLNVSTMMSGLLVNAGVGLLVLFRVNHHWKENMMIILALYLCGIAGGFLSGFVL